jgi:hypothetical protein
VKRIKCTLSDIDKAIAELEMYEKELKRKTRTLMERLAEIGIKESEVRFKRAIYDGTNDVRVNDSPVWIDDYKLAITATGKSITFIEFGSGVHYTGEDHPKAGEFGYIRGGYGHHLGRMDSWRYEGDPGTNGEVITEGKHKGEVKTHGNPANRALYDSVKKMREEIVKIAKEVFGND